MSTPRGVEQQPESSGNQEVGDQSGAESGALGAQTARIDAGLAVVIEAWPTLAEPIKAGILAMIRATG